METDQRLSSVKGGHKALLPYTRLITPPTLEWKWLYYRFYTQKRGAGYHPSPTSVQQQSGKLLVKSKPYDTDGSKCVLNIGTTSVMGHVLQVAG